MHTTGFVEFESASGEFAAALRRGDKQAGTAARQRMEDLLANVSPAQARRARRFMRQAIAAGAVANPHDLPREAGVYVITSDTNLTDGVTGSRTYIGCSKDILMRFTNPTIGHLNGDNGTRSAQVFADGPHVISVVYVSTEVRTDRLVDDLVAAEALWWMLSVAASSTVVNASSSIGAMSERAGAWVVGAELTSSRTVIARGPSEMLRVVGRPEGLDPGLIGTVASGYQNSSHGWTFRWATEVEVAVAEREGPGAMTFGPVEASWDGELLCWTGGTLDNTSRKRLAARRRGSYSKANKTPYAYVVRLPDTKDGQARYGAYYATSPDSAKRSRTTYVGRRYATPLEAARARELFLDAHPDLSELNERNVLPAA
jgi:hypothetical protein